jgi:hypothetical protein
LLRARRSAFSRALIVIRRSHATMSSWRSPRAWPDAHPRARQQREQEAVAQPRLRVDDRRDLLERQRLGQRALLGQPPALPALSPQPTPGNSTKHKRRFLAARGACGRVYEIPVDRA